MELSFVDSFRNVADMVIMEEIQPFVLKLWGSHAEQDWQYWLIFVVFLFLFWAVSMYFEEEWGSH